MDQELIVSLKQQRGQRDDMSRHTDVHTARGPRMWIWYVSVLVAAGALLAGVYVYKSSQLTSAPQPQETTRTSTTTSDVSKQAVEQEVGNLVAEVGKLILLPENETPTVATVSDPSKLSGEAFFARAKVGDKVLLYTKAGKAYLYDPVAHRLVEVAPITTQAK